MWGFALAAELSTPTTAGLHNSYSDIQIDHRYPFKLKFNRLIKVGRRPDKEQQHAVAKPAQASQ
jgi:hypothetical protein